MKRRNFVLGLGTIATASGAVAVTAASFAESVEARADFRVAVERNLTVERGEGFETDNPDFESDGIDFENIDAEDLPQVYVNDQENDDLEAELAIANDDELSESFDGMLQIRNDGSTTETVGIDYVYGTDVTEGDIEEETVTDLFQFQIDGELVSPEDPETQSFVEVEGHDTVEVDLHVEMPEGGAEEIAGEAGDDGNPFDGATETVDLLDEIDVGTEDN